MSCDVIQRGDLDAYVTGELGPAEARNVEAHLFGCGQCAAELRRLRAEQRLFRVRAEQEVAAVPSFEGVLARIDGAAAGKGGARRPAAAPARAGGAGKVPAPAKAGAGGKSGAPPRAGWSSFLAPAGVAVAALAAAAASWMGVRTSPVDDGGRPRVEVEDPAIGPDRVCTSEAPVSDEPTASEVPVKSEAVARAQDDSGVCGAGSRVGEVCGAGEGVAAEACDEAAVAWCAARP